MDDEGSFELHLNHLQEPPVEDVYAVSIEPILLLGFLHQRTIEHLNGRGGEPLHVLEPARGCLRDAGDLMPGGYEVLEELNAGAQVANHLQVEHLGVGVLDNRHLGGTGSHDVLQETNADGLGVGVVLQDHPNVRQREVDGVLDGEDVLGQVRVAVVGVGLGEVLPMEDRRPLPRPFHSPLQDEVRVLGPLSEIADHPGARAYLLDFLAEDHALLGAVLKDVLCLPLDHK